VTAFAVAGGRSRRMGRDKALLPWAGATLLDHTLDRLRAVCDDVRILCGPEARYAERGLPLVRDALPDAGPLAGVLAGLDALGGDAGAARAAALFLAIDLPVVPPALLVRLLGLLAGHDAVVPVLDAGPQPLCAVYAAGCADSIRRRLARGERKMTCFWPDVRVREVGAERLREFGDPQALFLNLNSPRDYAGET
jgi:molybdopterin-guanine dinucleotide biosynthesis protein A